MSGRRSVENEGKIFWLVFVLGSLMATSVMMYLSIWMQSVVFFVLIVVAMTRSEAYGILHPVSWFSIFFYLYAVSFPLLMTFEGYQDERLYQIIPLSVVTYCAFIAPIVFITPFTLNAPRIKINGQALQAAHWSVLGVCVFLLFYVASQGIASKREFVDFSRGSSIGLLLSVFSLAALMFAVQLLASTRRGRRNELRIEMFNVLSVLTILVLAVGYGVTGERDYIFRVLLFGFLVLFCTQYREKYHFYYLLIAVFALVLVLPLSQAAKAVVLTKELNYSGFESGDFFRTEFSSAGRNLYYLMSKGLNDYGGETLVWDLKRYVGIFFPGQESTGMWFNNHLRSVFGDESSSGWGFSLMGEGYLNFGYIGAPLMFLFVGGVTACVYSIAGRSDICFIFYLAYIPMMIYVLRADFANFLSLGFKINLIMTGVFWALKEYAVRSEKTRPVRALKR